MLAAGSVSYYLLKADNDINRSLSKTSKAETTEKSATKTNPVDQVTQNQPTPKTEAVNTDPTADWKTFTEKTGIYQFKYPASWVFAANPNGCSEGTVLFGVDKQSTGICASDSVGQMAVFVFDGDSRADLALIAPGYKDTTNQKIKISGLDANKYTGTFNVDSEAGFGPQKDDEIIRYMILYKNKTYTINYYDLKASGYPDAKADLDTLVTKTFKFL